MDLTTTDVVARFRQIIERDQQGDWAGALKRLNDWCFDQQEYSWQPVLTLFRWHCERLGMDWAVRLCDLRTPSDTPSPRVAGPAPAGPNPAWEALVRQVFGV